ncbi:dihydrolipoamide acetyltransferase family protein [Flavonifractor sp. HCP28S3_F3]|uniref:dihydrolipoamide acetyltransferase family protein n=1 Tax=Flavonifractor sp. HCP28S3_F3 TaxID=3438939 RepID=UPI003F889A33
MAEVIIMPKLGFNMDEGQLVKWHKAVGDPVTKGEVLFEINTDKTTMPVEATADGTVLKIMLEEGAFADVFTPIAVVGAPGEDPDAALAAAGGEAPAAAPAAADAAPAQVPQVDLIPEVPPMDLKELKLTPKAKKLVKEEGIAPSVLAQIKGTGFQGGITYKDIKASPLARKVAEQKGVDLAAVPGSGPNGKIMKADVEKAAAQPVAASDELQIASVTPYKGVRKIIGDKLAQSMATAPHIYFTDAVDTTELTAFRSKLNETAEVKISVSDLLTLAACKALKKYPALNATLKDGQIITYRSINVGTAVAGNNGLVVPVIKNVQHKTLTEIAGESKDLIARAKEGRLDPKEYSDGTFSISNLGMFGIGNFTAIINAPESAILAVSSVRKTPVVVTDENGEDTIAIRPMMNIQLSVDHRLIDGLMAAQFVAYIKRLLENPVEILL